MAGYLLDSNFFIQAHRVNYPFDVAPGFWNKIIRLAEQGTISSIDKVKQEICQGEDELKSWIENSLPNSFFLNSAGHIVEYTQLVSWTASVAVHYTPKAIEEFLDAERADAWLIACAIARDMVIVTHETSSKKKVKIKIPDVCASFGVECINTIDLFRRLGETF